MKYIKLIKEWIRQYFDDRSSEIKYLYYTNLFTLFVFLCVYLLKLKLLLLPTGQPDCLVRCLLMLPINLLTRDCQAAQTAVAVRGNDSLSPLCLFEMAALFTQKCAEAKRFVFFW